MLKDVEALLCCTVCTRTSLVFKKYKLHYIVYIVYIHNLLWHLIPVSPSFIFYFPHFLLNSLLITLSCRFSFSDLHVVHVLYIVLFYITQRDGEKKH